MSTRTACRRRTRRFTVNSGQNIWVEFEYPSRGGQSHRLPLVDISASGISFALTNELPLLESGTSLPDVVIHVESAEMRGDLLILHVTPVPGGATICGALFYPSDDTELVKLKSVVSGIQAVHSG